jgi:L,D-transpeptidase YcbB
MKVVVGAKETQTPMLAGALNYAVLNPYWNVPDYLVRTNVAKKMVEGRTLASMHMEVLSDWSTNATKLDPATVDWAGVAAATAPLPRVRELPWKYNSMGAVKFVFPNDHGIYLHDTPHRELFAQDDRHLSNGCIRLEKAWVLGEWMMGKALAQQAKKAGAEQPVPMSASVPVYLTYITVAPSDDGGVTLLPDIYGRDMRR